MTSKTKRLISIVSAIVIVVVIIGGISWGVTACNNTYKGKIMAAIVSEEFYTPDLGAFPVGKNVPYKDELLFAINEIIAELGVHEKIKELELHHSRKYRGINSALSFAVPDPSNNTGGVLVLYGNHSQVPMSYLGNGNEVCGMNIDILKFVAMKLNRKIETRNCELGAIIGHISQTSTSEWRMSGECMWLSPERQAAAAFSDVMMIGNLVIISKEKHSWNKVEDLNSKRIGALVGSPYISFVENKIADGSYNNKTKIEKHQSFNSMYQAFLSGKIDTFLMGPAPCEAIFGDRLAWVE